MMAEFLRVRREENIDLLAKVGGLLIKLGGWNLISGFDEKFKWLMFSYQEGLCG